ncbi:MAG: SRPBCC domain-containing protein [Gemmatimonadaceae bacterium]
MPRQKDLKRLVRARMQKTGEAYTAARAQLLRKPKTPKRPGDAAVAPAAPITVTHPEPKDYAAIAGMSDAAIKEKTGCTWELWVKALDYSRAYELSHREIAKLVKEKWDTPSWWSQTVTVGYERIKGLRERGQQRSGTFTMTRSRTFDVDVATLYEAWADGRRRKRWLGETGVKVRTATEPKSIRLQMPDGAIVAVGFTAKGNGKSSVSLEQARLPDRETAERLKQQWTERLDALREALES